jgi:hypothetical protein
MQFCGVPVAYVLADESAEAFAACRQLLHVLDIAFAG